MAMKDTDKQKLVEFLSGFVTAQHMDLFRRIVATTPHQHGVTLPDFDLEPGKVALLFGTEMRGLSHTVLSMSDEFLRIPMYGFTESFNISVSAAIILYHLRQQLNQSRISWQLSRREKTDLLLHWLRISIKRSDLLIEQFLSK